MLDTLTSERAGTVRAAVKRVALTQLAAGGPSAVALNAIARELGVSGPALYRYFRNRDALLTELVLDAYNDLAEALTGAESLPRAYRAWALEEPHRYRLLFAAPLPGYDAHQPELVAAAQRSMDLLLKVEPDRERAVVLWSRMHGHVSLEIEGNFASMGLDPERLYAATLGLRRAG
ncbi:MAG TPA: TetR/AcrR family transcriptional regulator [Solirubrobacter sp.]